MKNTFLILSLLYSAFLSAQAFQGKGDQKLQIGAHFQDNVNG